MPQPRFFAYEADSAVSCSLCPHRCYLAPGKSGLCRVRRNAGGKLELPFYGMVSAANLDPIEKKPLYHFRPGSSVFSIGFVGCNLRCPFCQNWEISQGTDADVRFLRPEQSVELALGSGCGAIAYTYSEPLVHIEYLIDAMEAAREAGLANVLVTNGCATEEAAAEVLRLCDAANVDLKTASAETYEKTLGGSLEAVKRFIALAFEMGVHTEVTTLAVTGLSDTESEIGECAVFLASLSPDIPYHLSAYHPDFRYRREATAPILLDTLAATARKSLKYVYVGNVAGENQTTRCPECGAAAVKRQGYRIDASGIERDGTGKAQCRACGNPLPISY